MRKTVGRAPWLALLGAVIVATAATGVAVAASAQQSVGSTVAVACVNNTSGQLRVVDSGSQCSKREHVLLLQLPVAGGRTSFAVDCTAGQKVSDVLAEVAEGTQRVVVEITGTCAESVNVMRDDVTLVAAVPGAGLAASESGDPLRLQGVRGIEVVGLTLTGGGTALDAVDGAVFLARDVTVTGAEIGIQLSGGANGVLENVVVEQSTGFGAGVGVRDNSTLRMYGGRVADNADRGVDCDSGYVQLEDVLVTRNAGNHAVVAEWTGCSIRISGSQIVDNQADGALAFGGGVVTIHGSLVSGNSRSGAGSMDGGVVGVYSSVVRDNLGPGLFAASGSTVDVQRSTISGNGQGGINANGASAMRVESDTVVEGNTGGGVQLSDTSVGTFDPSVVVRDNSGWGVYCAPAPSVAMLQLGEPFTVTGNTAGQVSCPGY